jgi:hypothetical protein
VKYPTAIYVDGTKLVVGTIGDPMTSGSKGALFTMGLDGSSVAQLGTSAANFNGIEKDGTISSYLVGTQRDRTVNQIAVANGASTVYQDCTSEGAVSVVDIGWDPTNRILAVPDVGNNAVYFYKK